MADNKQKSLQLPSYLTRLVPSFSTPKWLEAERWRSLVANQPVAAACQDTIINDIIASDWEVRPRNPKEQQKLQTDIDAYKSVLQVDNGFGLRGFDFWIERGVQDLLTLPIGWNNEVIRLDSKPGKYTSPDKGKFEFKLDNPKGHVYKIVPIDGSTIFTTYDAEFPIAQKLMENITQTVFFKSNEIARTVMSPRPELTRNGYGIAPPEKIFLAIAALSRGDQYYASLLLDTPEAGILDLGDMSEESATQWLSGFKTLFEGIDPFKIPVMYEHEQPIQWIPFGRPPTDMLFDTIILKYSGLVHAGYGLMLSDTGLGTGGSPTLAGSIREERRTRRSGFAVTKEKIKNMIDLDILPEYLEFIWLDNDEERKTEKGRSFLTFVQALKNAKDAGILTPEDAHHLLKSEGFIPADSKFTEPPQEGQGQQPPPQEEKQDGEINKKVKGIQDKVLPSDGGLGDITGKSLYFDNTMFNRFNTLMGNQFNTINKRATEVRLNKLIKQIIISYYPVYLKAQRETNLKDDILDKEIAKSFFGEFSLIDNYPDVIKANNVLLEQITKLLDKEDWYLIPKNVAIAISLILRFCAEEGANYAINTVQNILNQTNRTNIPDILSMAYDLTSSEVIHQIESYATEVIDNVNKGTRFYLARLFTSVIANSIFAYGLSNNIDQDKIQVDKLVKDKGFLKNIVTKINQEMETLKQYRLKSIVNTEIGKIQNFGRLQQYKKLGLTRKMWVTSGLEGVCSLCSKNEELGFVDIDYSYTDVSGNLVQTPPGHPGNCHCSIECDENEVIYKQW